MGPTDDSSAKKDECVVDVVRHSTYFRKWKTSQHTQHTVPRPKMKNKNKKSGPAGIGDLPQIQDPPADIVQSVVRCGVN